MKWWLITVLWLGLPVYGLDFYARNQPIRDVLPPLARELGRSVLIDERIDDALTISLREVSFENMLAAVAQQLDVDLLWQDDIAILRKQAVVVREVEAMESTPLASESEVSMPPVCNDQVWLLKHAKAKQVGALIKQYSSQLVMVVDERTNGIWLQDCLPESPVPELIAWLDQPVNQIEISAQIAQVRHSRQSKRGARWWLDGLDTSGNGLTSNIGLASVNAPVGLEALASIDGHQLTLALDWLEANGDGEVISRPKIVTAEGKMASIQSGTEIPYQVTGDDGNSVQFRQAGLTLEVTPYVQDKAKLLLELNIHQDAVGELVNGVPSIETNHLSTQVHVEDAATLVLGGIYRDESFASVSKVPLLGDLPWIGRWFQYSHRQEEKVELVVFITPKLLKKAVN